MCVYLHTEFQAKGAIITQIGFVYALSTICVLFFSNNFFFDGCHHSLYIESLIEQGFLYKRKVEMSVSVQRYTF